MKITNKELRKIIKEELNNVIQEMQVGLGLSHNFSNEELYQHTLDFLSQNPNLEIGTPEYEKAEGLRSILDNRVVQVVQHHGDETSPEDTEYMREIQGKLKMVRQALMQAMPGVVPPDPQARSWRQSRRERYRQMSKDYDDRGIHKYSSDRPYQIRKKWRWK